MSQPNTNSVPVEPQPQPPLSPAEQYMDSEQHYVDRLRAAAGIVLAVSGIVVAVASGVRTAADMTRQDDLVSTQQRWGRVVGPDIAKEYYKEPIKEAKDRVTGDWVRDGITVVITAAAGVDAFRTKRHMRDNARLARASAARRRELDKYR